MFGIILNMKRHYVFGQLFARPSIVEGVGRIVDLGATMQKYNESKTEEEADVRALKNDWRAVGEDFRKSIANYEQKTSPSKSNG